MTDPLGFAALVLVLVAAFAVAMSALRRIGSLVARSGALVAVLVALVALSLKLKVKLGLLMGEIAAAWVVALLLWSAVWLVASRRRTTG